MTRLPLMALMCDMNDGASSNIQSIKSSSTNISHQNKRPRFDPLMFDRPGIGSVNNNRINNTSEELNAVRNSMPVLSKKEFIEQWLMKQNNVGYSENVSGCSSSSSSSSSSSLILNSPKSKKISKSSSKSYNKIKQFKKKKIKKQSDKYKNSEDIENIPSEYNSNSPDNQPSNYFISDVKYQSCKPLMPSSSKSLLKQSLTLASEKNIKSIDNQSMKLSRVTSYRKSALPIINNVENQSPNITDVESLAPSSPLFERIDGGIEFESPKKLDTQSHLSSIQATNITSDSELDVILDSDQNLLMDATYNLKNQTINNADKNSTISIHNSECDTPSIFSAERRIISPVNSSDSDRTFFSDNESLNCTIIKCEKKIQLSQKISEDCESLKILDVKTVDTVDQVNSSENILPSRSVKLENFDNYPTMSNINIKKKKKLKKGSLTGRLQTLITSQTSFLRIWRHQMAQMHLITNKKQCVTLKIIHSSLQYGRQYFHGLVINDTHNLLDIRTQEDHCPGHDKVTNSPSLSAIITVLTAPEIVGTISINEKSALEIYPPWEVIDVDKNVLSVLYFRIIINSFVVSDINTVEKNHVPQKFHCPCLKAKQLVESCNTKFTDVKPTMPEYLFND